uniref:Uncharacterized protein n=1 Tax=viral metagenome TaxID=1070528 RepID=A0A6M3LBG4_9ZZZZ
MKHLPQRPPKYALHPGPVRSLEGDCRWIGYWQLVRLYKLHPRDCIEWNTEAPETHIGRHRSNYIHLYALFNEDYLETRLALEAETKRYKNLLLNGLKDVLEGVQFK